MKPFIDNSNYGYKLSYINFLSSFYWATFMLILHHLLVVIRSMFYEGGVDKTFQAILADLAVNGGNGYVEIR